MTLLETPTGTSLFYYRDIKQEMVQTWLLEEYGVSNKYTIILDKRRDETATSTQTETNGSFTQDPYCARGSGRGAKKQRRNGDEKKRVY